MKTAQAIIPLVKEYQDGTLTDSEVRFLFVCVVAIGEAGIAWIGSQQGTGIDKDELQFILPKAVSIFENEAGWPEGPAKIVGFVSV